MKNFCLLGILGILSLSLAYPASAGKIQSAKPGKRTIGKVVIRFINIPEKKKELGFVEVVVQDQHDRRLVKYLYEDPVCVVLWGCARDTKKYYKYFKALKIGSIIDIKQHKTYWTQRSTFRARILENPKPRKK